MGTSKALGFTFSTRFLNCLKTRNRMP